MTVYSPQSTLATHEVTNQPPEYAPDNLYFSDVALREAVAREGGASVAAKAAALGASVAAAEVREWGEQANRYPPELTPFDRYGRRIDAVRFHPAYHALMTLAMQHRVHAVAWEGGAGGHVAHAAMLSVFTQVEAGVMCPVSMTHASVAALRLAGGVGEDWASRAVAGVYDPALRPVGEKAGITIGMAMTEKQGGSDLRANTTRAVPGADGLWRLTGHKWFCSAPMSDAFLTLAQTDAGLSCFLVPRIAPDGALNAIHLMRLKEKLGNRSNASAEIEYHGAAAFPLGEPGRGVATIIEMVQATRLDTMAGALGLMRAALAQAAHHVAYRTAFQRKLIGQPAMRAVIADLALEYEAACALTMRVARAFESAPERGFARLSVAIGKYYLTKRCPGFVYECLECFGGGGYVEEGGMPRLYREAPLNAIWEGSGNVIALDVLRTLARERGAYEAFRGEVALARGGNAALDAAMGALDTKVTGGAIAEAEARAVAERMALALQASLLARFAPAAVADAFCATRLEGGWRGLYGSLPGGADVAGILARVG
jgi:putative acyl-CoA dehydrogenase